MQKTDLARAVRARSAGAAVPPELLTTLPSLETLNIGPIQWQPLTIAERPLVALALPGPPTAAAACRRLVSLALILACNCGVEARRRGQARPLAASKHQ